MPCTDPIHPARAAGEPGRPPATEAAAPPHPDVPEEVECTAAAPCPGCTVCDRCHTVVAHDDTVETVRGSTVCGRCERYYYDPCSQCDGVNRRGDMCGNGCDDSDDDDETCGGLIEGYSFRPRPVFHGRGPLFLGPEIEVATGYGERRACARLATEQLGPLGYLKEDASIGEGFEIVTHPMSYEWAMAHFPWSMLAELQTAGGRATASTGIHVHLSRAGFSSACHTYRWMKFVYRNQAQVTRLARRESSQWAAFTEYDRRAVKAYAKGACGERYRAINTNNADTFELRIFAGSLAADEVQAALGFAAASVEYTRGLSTQAIARRDGWQWPAFVDWLDERPAYAPLRAQLEVLSCAC
jgi:hypothetical protein